MTQLEQFLFEEACRLEQAAALTGRAREFLKEQRVLEPAEFRIARIVGEQRSRAREHIFRRVAASVPNGLAGTPSCAADFKQVRFGARLGFQQF